jgi:hypothetical protein
MNYRPCESLHKRGGGLLFVLRKALYALPQTQFRTPPVLIEAAFASPLIHPCPGTLHACTNFAIVHVQQQQK